MTWSRDRQEARRRASQREQDRARQQLAADPNMTVDQYLARQEAADYNRITADTYDYRTLFVDWLRDGRSMPSFAHDQLVQADQFERELRDLGVGTDAAGGYVVPPDMVRRLLVSQKRGSAMIRAAGAITTTRGQATSVPLLDDLSTVGAIVTEAGAGTVDTATPFAEKALGAAYMYHSRIIKASWQFVQDLGFPVESWLPRLIGSRIGRAADPHFATGTGSGQPTGVVATATVGKQGIAGQTLTVKWEDLIDVIHAVDPDYREDQPEDGIVGWQLSDAALKMTRKVVDSAGQPIVADGMPLTICGYPAVVNNNLPVPGVSNKTLFFAHWPAAYLVRQVLGDVAILRLTETYAGTGQAAFIGFARQDGVPGDPLALRCYQHSAT